MKCIEDLKAEHRAVLVTLDILEKICNDLNNNSQVNHSHIEQIIEFLTVFVDKCHHGKEERILFPAMEVAGVPNNGGPIGAMLLEHEQGRKYIRGMKDTMRALDSSHPENVQTFLKSATNYKTLLTAHISKEDNVLYPMAEERFSQELDLSLMEQFDTLEETEIGVGKHEEFHQMLKTLKGVYLG